MKKEKAPIRYNFYVESISEDDEPAYMAIVPAFREAMIFGDTMAELEDGIRAFIEFEMDELKKAGKPIPSPDRKSKYTGKLILRIDPHLHEKLALQSKARRMSLNKYIHQKLNE